MTKIRPSDSNIGYHQAKLDDDAYNKLKHEREHLCKMGRHASFSDALRELCQDALNYRKSLK